ncbi:MAG: alpha-amylase family glycosyl hydrolase [Pseudomonadota bacterium]
MKEASKVGEASDSPATDPWWKGAVIYQIYPRSFLDTTGSGVGDLEGIIRKLDYVASLGVDAIWISPFFTSPMKDYGYDVADYCDVDPAFGTLDDFDRLIERAHDLGVKVVIDQVYSHTSDMHPWFIESRSSRDNPKADWYVWANAKSAGSPPSNWQSVFGGPAWSWDARRQQYFMHNFLREQPQLNVHNPEVQDALLSAAKFWLDRGVDGFRLDAINFSMHNGDLTDNPPSNIPMSEVTRPFDMQLHVHNQSQPEITQFLGRIRSLLDQYGVTYTVAEVGGPNPIGEMKAFTHGNALLNSAYSFDFLYAEDIGPERIHDSLAQWPGKQDEGWPSWAFSNHDTPRAISRWAAQANGAQAAKVLNMLLLSLRGNPFIYQGEELGLPQSDVPFERLLDPEAIANWPRTLGRDGARTPISWDSAEPFHGFSAREPWLPVDPEHASYAVAEQEADPTSCLNVTRTLIGLRRQYPVFRTGRLKVLQSSEGLLVFEREDQDHCIVCAYNLTDKARRVEFGCALETFARETGGADTVLIRSETLPAWSGLWARKPG